MLLLKNVAVIPMDKEGIIRDCCVAVKDGIIQSIGRDIPMEEGAKVVDCQGGYLIPGLCDMHVHLEALLNNGDYFGGVYIRQSRSGVDWNQYIKMYLAMGITQVRNMSGTTEILRMRDDVEKGKMEGPHIYCLSPIIDGKSPLWPTSIETISEEEAVRAVRTAKAEGYDGIKIYNNLTTSQFDAILAAADEEGMTVSGHVPIKVGIEHCLESQFRGYEHVKAIPKEYVDKAAAMHKIMTPTLVTQRSMEVYGDDNACERMFQTGQEMHLSPEALSSWKGLAEMLSKHNFRLDRNYKEYRTDVSRFLQGGGVVMAGTDSNFPFALPGYALHEELREMVLGGMSPYQALESATRVPAQFMGVDGRRGTIEPGKEADMVLLRNNPLQDISNTFSIQGVSFQGRWYDKEDLDRLIADVDTETAKYNSAERREQCIDL